MKYTKEEKAKIISDLAVSLYGTEVCEDIRDIIKDLETLTDNELCLIAESDATEAIACAVANIATDRRKQQLEKAIKDKDSN